MQQQQQEQQEQQQQQQAVWYHQDMAKNMVPGLQERLRSFVSAKGAGAGVWDYVVYWKLNDEQRYIDWAGCCCGGNGRDFFHQYMEGSGGSCPDSLPHSATKTCGLLSAMTLAPPMPLVDSAGIHAQVLLSGQPRWIKCSEEVQTKVYIPVHNGVVEMGSYNQMPENATLVQSVRAKCGDPWQDFHGFQEVVVDHQAAYKSPFYKNNQQEQQQQQQHEHFVNAAAAGGGTEWATSSIDGWEQDVALDSQFSLNLAAAAAAAAPSQLNFLTHKDRDKQQPQQEMASGNPPAFSDSPHGSALSKDNSEVKQEARADSSDCSDQVDDDDDKGTGRSGRRHLSKNLVAERKRRKKLNERLYSLRALVPKITKMDRASILGDAIEYVKELQQQVKELQDELEDESQGPNSLDMPHHMHHHHHHHHLAAALAPPPLLVDDVLAKNSGGTGNKGGGGGGGDDGDKELAQPMQVEVSKMDTHLFTLRIFCEKRPGVFVKLVQALDVLGLDVLHANITTFRGLVLNVFNAEIRDKELMQAEQVKETLLEMTSQPESRSSSTFAESRMAGVITIDA